MDKIKTSYELILKMNQFEDGELPEHTMIYEVCSYYDKIKNEKLSSADKEFLYYIANKVGIPQYFDMLEKFKQETKLSTINLSTLSSSIYESSLYTSKDIKLHRFQKEVLDFYKIGKVNRYFLSASTSFGKTFLVYEIIRKMRYKNILLIFPTIALLSENLDRIYSNIHYKWIRDQYKIHTISNIPESNFGEYNIFLYTPERYLSFLDFYRKITFNFAFVDEVYKIDNEYLEEGEIIENERDIAYRIALFYIFLNINIDILFAGPYIEFSKESEKTDNPSFDLFLNTNHIQLLDYNLYEIVNKEYLEIKSKNCYQLENFKIPIGSTNINEKYLSIVKKITENQENIIVYCPNRKKTEIYAKSIVENENFKDIDTSVFIDFVNHLSTMFINSSDWIALKALKKGVGIHHGLIPKYIQKEIINLFNKGYIKILLSTTTITEGVNTTAKNILVLSHKKGNKELKKFDALNIAGRAGRFLNHYKGNVIILDSKFTEIKNGIGEPIKHKHYDRDIPKGDIDIFYTDDIYLNPQDKIRKTRLLEQQKEYNIPKWIFNQFKAISTNEKITIYKYILQLSEIELYEIKRLISTFNSSKKITYEGVEIIINIVSPLVKDKNLKFLMETKQKGKDNKILTALLFTFFKYGFRGMVDYGCTNQQKDIDISISDTSKFVYNTLKYQIVKYFGVFNLMYKYYLMKTEKKEFNEIIGIDSLLIKMEYNANTEKGRLASDYGVPQRIINYYDTDDSNESRKIQIYKEFDSYERKIFLKTKDIIDNREK